MQTLRVKCPRILKLISKSLLFLLSIQEWCSGHYFSQRWLGGAHDLCCRRLAGQLCSPLGPAFLVRQRCQKVKWAWADERRAGRTYPQDSVILLWVPDHRKVYVDSINLKGQSCISGHCSSQSCQEQGWRNLLHLLWNTQVNITLSWVMTVFQQWYHLTSKASRWGGLRLRHSEWVCCKGQRIFIAHHHGCGAEE